MTETVESTPETTERFPNFAILSYEGGWLYIDRTLTPDLYHRLNRTTPSGRYLQTPLPDDPSFDNLLSPSDVATAMSHQKRIRADFEQRHREMEATIRGELKVAGITNILIATVSKHPEVPSNYWGQLKHHRFYRGWIYWDVDSDKISPELANRIYNDPIGRQFIRTNGISGPQHGAPSGPLVRNRDPRQCGPVSGYHIDTPAALKRFVELVTAHDSA